jgi:hypothetical protein
MKTAISQNAVDFQAAQSVVKSGVSGGQHGVTGGDLLRQKCRQQAQLDKGGCATGTMVSTLWCACSNQMALAGRFGRD